MAEHNQLLQASGSAVFLIGVGFGADRLHEQDLDELALLAESAQLTSVGRLVVHRQAPDAAFFIGSGKVDEIKMLATASGASSVLFDQTLSPGQQRNLEKRIGLPVNDRTFLILEIFAQRARSHEGRIQVELASLQYQSSRLVRRWTHLSRQKGGVLGGEGEKQIELDRRMMGGRIKSLKKQLEKVKKQRNTQRRARTRNEVFRVSLVGYTNAGKSTLFNALVKAKAYAADQLFATLDTTVRSLYLQGIQRSISLSDTVGFIKDLPHGLVKAFTATLQEATEADLLLHVVDASNAQYAQQIQQVQQVLEEIGADHIPQILVFNKMDAIPEEAQPRALQDWFDVNGTSLKRVFVSALNGAGFPELRELLQDAVLQAGTQSPQDSSENFNNFIQN